MEDECSNMDLYINVQTLEEREGLHPIDHFPSKLLWKAFENEQLDIGSSVIFV